MSRKNLIYNFQPIVTGSMASATIIGLQTEVAQFDTATYDFSWSGGNTTNGLFSLEYSRDGINWSSLDFGTTINGDGASGLHQLIVETIGFKFLRPKYVRTNGAATGTLTVSLFCTNKGA